MIRLNEGDKIRIVSVVVLHENSLVLQPDYCDPIAEIFCEGCDAEAKR